MTEVELLRKKLVRIQKSQEEAERLLEVKSRELYELNQNLERQVVERTKEFEKARNEAVEANKAKSQFLANMSHEIRTPLNGMLGFIGLLEKSSLTDVQREQLSTISKSGHLLLDIITDILEFSKIEAGKLQIDSAEFHLKRCVEDILEVMSNQIYEKNLAFPIFLDEAIPRKLLGDEWKIRQVLVNLIGNAIKFTPSGEISVEVHSRGITPDGRHAVYFEVRDTGVGISEKRIHSIFSAFEQADVSDTRKYGGTGLGLTISQQIVSAMGGHLKVESKEAKGSKFFFEIALPQAGSDSKEVSTRNFKKKEEVAVLISNRTEQRNLILRLQSWNAICWPVDSLDRLAWKNDGSVNRNLILDHLFLSNSINADRVKELLSDGVHVIVIAPPKEKALLSEKLKDLKLDIVVKPLKREDLFNTIKNKTSLSDKMVTQQSFVTEEHELARAHVLLVEDNLINQQVASAMLKIHGFTVDVASNGKEATEVFDPQKHQLILMDCQMPVMDGFEATQLIRRKHPSVPIIAMTANAFKETKEMCFEVGMNDFITKPINDEDLSAVVKKNLLQTQK